MILKYIYIHIIKLVQILYKKVRVKCLLLLSILLLSACDYSPRCIDASDFGQPRGSPAIMGDNVEPRFGKKSQYNFIERTWSTYTGFVLNGDKLEMTIKGAYSPWSKSLLAKGVCGLGKRVEEEQYYGKVCNIKDDFDEVSLSEQTGALVGHQFKANIDCGNNTTEPNICWFPYGLGVYIGLAQDPRNDKELLYHLLSEPSSDGLNKFIIYETELNDIKQKLGVDNWSSIKIYLRVHDNYYDDNVNGCIRLDAQGRAKTVPTHKDIRVCNNPLEIVFLSGARNEEVGFLENAARIFMDPAKNFIYTAYHAYINSDTYRTIYILVWTLFVVFMGIGFFLGVLQMSKAELTSVLLRFAVISALLSPDSWEFFNEYVVEGIFSLTANLANMVLDATNRVLYGGSDVVSFSIGQNIDTHILQNVDDVLYMFVSHAVNVKIAALLFSHVLGWLFIIVLYFSFLVVISAIIKLTVIFIFIFITLTILLSLAPIFILFAVFKYTRNSYFQAWLQALMGSAIQPMMLFVFLGLFLSIISYFLMDMLYYQACWRTIVPLLLFDIKFWRITEVYNYNYGIPISTGGNSPNIDLIKILMLYLSALLIRYITEMVPKIADKISGGISIEAVGAMTNKVVGMAEKMTEKIGGTTLKVLGKRTVGRAAATLADKALPKGLAKIIPGTEAKKLHKAKMRITQELKKKGWSQAQIDKGFKDGSLDGKMKDELAFQQAKKDRHGKKTLNPTKMAMGLVKEIYDKVKMSMEEDKLKGSGKRLNKTKKRSLKKETLRSDIAKVKNAKNEDGSSKLDKKLNQAIGKQGGDADLGKAVRKLKDSGKDYQGKEELHNDLREELQKQGYSEKTADMLINRDEEKDKTWSGESSRIEKEFPSLKEKGAEDEIKVGAKESGEEKNKGDVDILAEQKNDKIEDINNENHSQPTLEESDVEIVSDDNKNHPPPPKDNE